MKNKKKRGQNDPEKSGKTGIDPGENHLSHSPQRVLPQSEPGPGGEQEAPADVAAADPEADHQPALPQRQPKKQLPEQGKPPGKGPQSAVQAPQPQPHQKALGQLP